MDATEPVSPQRPPQSQVGKWVLLAVLAGLALAYLTIYGTPGRPPTGTLGRGIGRVLPYFRLDPLTGESSPVAKNDLEGRVTLVNFWGTWCPPCVQEFPHLVKLREEFADNPDFRMYLVSCGLDQDGRLDPLRTETMNFLSMHGYNVPTWADQNYALRKALGLEFNWDQMSYPTTLILDRRGIVRGGWVGFLPGDQEQQRKLVESLLAEKK